MRTLRSVLPVSLLVLLAGCGGSAGNGISGSLPVSEAPSEVVADPGAPVSEAATVPPLATGGPEIFCPEPAPEGDLEAVEPGCRPQDQAKAEVVTPRSGMANVAPIAWTSAEPAADDQALRVTWSSGVEPCYVLDRVDVEETPEAVTVTLFQGSDPAAGTDTVCVAMATDKVVEVPLSAPLAGRPVVDGAAG